MIFTLGDTVVALSAPSQYPHKEVTELIQGKERSASGITHVESFEVRTGMLTYTFADMSTSDYQLLMGFFINTAEGMLHEFALTDDLGIVRTVRFTSPTLNFSNSSFQLWAGSFTVEQVS